MITSDRKPSPDHSDASAESLRALLSSDGVIDDARATLTPLTGGVSSEIYRIDQAGQAPMVVKRALPQLKVRDAWLADVRRNHAEQDFLRYVGAFASNSVPRLIFGSPTHHYLVMEWLDDRAFANWKSQLLGGEVLPAHAKRAGELLGTIHRHAWDDAFARQTFATDANFHALRIEPYLLTTGERHPALRAAFEREADRLAQTRETLVHGDFSPKNILVGDGRLVILDCEVAWFGDPAFDLAFLLNHLLLKSSAAPAMRSAYRGCIDSVLSAYAAAIADAARADRVFARLPTLLPMLVLARLDGKSPVEYLGTADTTAVCDRLRAFATECIRRPVVSVRELLVAFDRFVSIT